MKRSLALVIGLTLAATAVAQDRNKSPDTVPPVQAPPGMNDPGTVVLPTPQAEAAKAVQDTTGQPAPADAASDDITIAAEKPPVDTHPLPPEVQAAAEASELRPSCAQPVHLCSSRPVASDAESGDTCLTYEAGPNPCRASPSWSWRPRLQAASWIE